MGAFFTEAGRFIVAFKHRNILGHKLKSCASEPLPFFYGSVDLLLVAEQNVDKNSSQVPGQFAFI